MLQWYGALGGYTKAQLPTPLLALPHTAMQEACTSFAINPEAPLLAVAPGADYGPAKRWPPEHFAQVIAGFLRDRNHESTPTVLLLGSAKDQTHCQRIIEHLRFILNADEQAQVRQLAGLTTLPQAMALIQQAQGLVCNDSGPMHLAAALGTPVHAVFGSSSPTHTPPLSPRATVHYLGLPCSPCYQRECPLGHTDCLRTLQPELVLKGVLLRQLELHDEKTKPQDCRA
jgi:heptosyltransferase-2